MRVIKSRGNPRADIFVCGEAPGFVESQMGYAFVGPSGQEQDAMSWAGGINPKQDCWFSNVVKEYHEDNPDPTEEMIVRWAPVLVDELRNVNPKMIIAVGRFATEWFLGRPPFRRPMYACNGVPAWAGCFGDCPAAGVVDTRVPIVPVIHPAAGLRTDRDRPLVEYGYQVAGQVYNRLRNGDWSNGITDIGEETYTDVSGEELSYWCRAVDRDRVELIGFDTEGDEDDPWSVQVSGCDGEGLVMRMARDDSAVGIAALQQLATQYGLVWAMNNAPHDIRIARCMGLDLSDARIEDNMIAAGILRRLPMGLKEQNWFFFRDIMQSYSQVVGKLARDAQFEWLECVGDDADFDIEYSRKEYVDNAGRKVRWKPTNLAKRAREIVRDRNKVLKDGPTDPRERWRNLPSDDFKREHILMERLRVEREHGPMPDASLEFVWQGEDPQAAIDYAGRDAERSRRIWPLLKKMLEDEQLMDTYRLSMANMPAAVEIRETGVPASRKYFEKLYPELTQQAHEETRKLVDMSGITARTFTEKKVYKSVANVQRYCPGAWEAKGGWVDQKLKANEGMRQARVLSVEEDVTVTTPSGNEKAVDLVTVENRWCEDRRYFNPRSRIDAEDLIKHTGLLHLCKKETPSGDQSTGKDSIEHLRHPCNEPGSEVSERQAKIVDQLFNVRHLYHVRDAFAWPPLVKIPPDRNIDFMHGDIFLMTESRRFKMSGKARAGSVGFNPMQVPSRTEIGRRIRAGYIAPPGYVLISSDYDQLEIRMQAALSRDAGLVNVFRQAEPDPHQDTADLVGVSRDVAKTLNFLMQYRGTGYGLQRELHKRGIYWTREQCDAAVRKYRLERAGVAEWEEREIMIAKARGYAETRGGMRRYLPALRYDKPGRDKAGRRYEEACKHVVSLLIQGGGREMVLRAEAELAKRTGRMRREGVDVRICLDIHDEVMLLAEDRAVDRASAELLECMTRYHGMDESLVKFTAGLAVGRTWAELKG